MISFTYQGIYSTLNEDEHRTWLTRVAQEEDHKIRDIAYIITTDEEVLALNSNYLKQDYYTDILTFDRSENGVLAGDIFISLDRVKENAITHHAEEEVELRRVMIHGVLHMMGYSDGTIEEKDIMRSKEDYYLKMFHVEQ